MTAEELEQHIRNGIPISGHMDFRVLALTDNTIRVRGGGEQNINVHGTAFAGSLYAVCALALWGLVHSRLSENASLVMAEGNIHYFKPVTGDIVASCEIASADLDTFLKLVHAKGKGRLEARVIVNVPGTDSIGAEFTATVYARLHK